MIRKSETAKMWVSILLFGEKMSLWNLNKNTVNLVKKSKEGRERMLKSLGTLCDIHTSRLHNRMPSHKVSREV